MCGSSRSLQSMTPLHAARMSIRRATSCRKVTAISIMANTNRAWSTIEPPGVSPSRRKRICQMRHDCPPRYSAADLVLELSELGIADVTLQQRQNHPAQKLFIVQAGRFVGER